jgi:hypothetical protein
MTKRTLWAIALVTAAGTLAAACADTIIKTLGPENEEEVTLSGNTFRYQSWNLDNVHDRKQFSWHNPGTKAMVRHRNFVHHGTVLITIRDVQGRLVDSIPAEWNMDHETEAGVPGLWTVKFEYFGARGRVDTSFEPAQISGQEQ